MEASHEVELDLSFRISRYKVITPTGSEYHLSHREIGILHAEEMLEPWEASKRPAGRQYLYQWIDSRTLRQSKTFDLRGLSCKPRANQLRISFLFAHA